MFGKPGFIHRVKPTLPIIHEELTQTIQGGLPGEHYHLSAALLKAVIDNINPVRIYSEAITSVNRDSMFSLTGDLMYVLVRTDFLPGNIQAVPSAGGAPTVSVPPLIPDVVTPVVVPPVTVVQHDTLYNQVVSASNMNVATGTATIVKADQYSSSAGPSGGTSGAVGSNTFPLFGHNTLEVVNPSAAFGAFAFLFITPKQAGGSIPTFPDLFTYEQWALMRTVGLDIFQMSFGSSSSGSKKQIFAIISPDGTGRLEIYSNGVPTGVYTPFAAALSRNTFHFFALERIADNTCSFAVDGVVKATINFSGIFGASAFGANCYAHAYGGYRITKGLTRYNGANHAVPATDFLTA